MRADVRSMNPLHIGEPAIRKSPSITPGKKSLTKPKAERSIIKMMRKRFQQKILDPIVALLKQGTSPESIALSMAFGMAIGVFPVLGTTTAICIVVATVLKLNHLAIQIANYTVYPLQFVLFIPFVRFGEFIFQIDPISGDPQRIISLAREDVLLLLKTCGISVASGCFAWLICAVPCVLCLKIVFSYWIKKIPSGLFSR